MDERVERNLQLQAFISKDVKRYCDVFEKNEGKDVFVHTNWAAFFFGPAWLFYRSMWLWGTLVLVAQYIIVFLVAFIMALFHIPEIVAAGELPNNLYVNIMLVAIVVLLLARLVFSLFADCIYRDFVNKNLGRTEGGVSIGGVILSYIVSGVISEVLSFTLTVIMVAIAGL